MQYELNMCLSKNAERQHNLNGTFKFKVAIDKQLYVCYNNNCILQCFLLYFSRIFISLVAGPVNRSTSLVNAHITCYLRDQNDNRVLYDVLYDGEEN